MLYSSHTLEHVSHYHDDARERYYFGEDSPELANHETKKMTNSDVGVDGVPGDVNNSVENQEASVPEESTSTVLRRWRQVPRSPASLSPSLSSPGPLSPSLSSLGSLTILHVPLYQVLAPGGMLVVSVPDMKQVSLAPSPVWCYRRKATPHTSHLTPPTSHLTPHTVHVCCVPPPLADCAHDPRR